MFLLWLCAAVAAKANEPVHPAIAIDGTFSVARLEGAMYALADPGRMLTLDDVLTGAASGGFRALPGALSAGYTSDAYWVRVPVAIKGKAPPLQIEMRPAYLDDVRLYVPQRSNPAGAADFREIRLGDHIPFRDRPVISVLMSAPLYLPDDFAGDIYIRLETTSTLALRGAIRTASSLAGSTTIQSLQLGLYEGLFLMTAIMNLLFWFRLRDRTYLAYAVYIVVQGLLTWAKSGLVPAEYMPGGGRGVDFVMSIGMFSNHFFGAVFVMVQTGSSRRFPLAHKIFVGFALMSALSLVASYFGYYQRVVEAQLLGALVISCVALLCNLFLLRDGVLGSAFACIAIACQILGSLAASLMLRAMVPYAAWMDYSYETGSIFFMIYMTVSLALRTQRAEKEREAARDEALAVARTSEQFAMNLVEQKTRELAAAKERAEAALRSEKASQEEQIRFVDVISHQYRTPLAVISSSLSAIRTSLESTDEKNLERIERSRRAIDRLVDIIDVNGHRSRMEGVAVRPTPGTVSLRGFLANVVGRASDNLGGRPVQLRLEGIGDQDTGHFDPGMIELALLNLIENSAKFSAPGKPILLTGSKDGDDLHLSVSDEGIGIPEEERDLLSRKYFRASNSGGTTGLGLGLYIVNSAVAAHGGAVDVQSTEGQNTTVSLLLPGVLRESCAGSLKPDVPDGSLETGAAAASAIA